MRGANCNPSLDIGAHSLHKGATSFVTSGSTAAPSYAAVAIRTGWTFGSMVSVYMKYNAAGDQYIGRMVAGLNTGSSDFAVLPPTFLFSKDEDEAAAQCAMVHNALNELFGTFPEVLEHVLMACLASLLAHFDLLSSYKATSFLLASSTFFQLQDLEHLKALVSFGFPWEDEFRWSTVTGIPPHVHILSTMLRN